MFRSCIRKRDHSSTPGQPEKGQSLAEFAFSMPFLIALLVGVMILAWVGFAYLSITSAARMGARHMLNCNQVLPQDPDQFATADEEITYVVTSSMPMLNWQEAQIILSPPMVARIRGSQVTVQIIYPMNTPTIRIPYIVTEGSFVLLPSLTLNAVSTMRID